MAPVAKTKVIDLSSLESDEESPPTTRSATQTARLKATRTTGFFKGYPRGVRDVVDLTSDDSRAKRSTKDNALDRLANAYSPTRSDRASRNRFKDVVSSGSKDAIPRPWLEQITGSFVGRGSTKDQALVLDSDDEPEPASVARPAQISKSPSTDAKYDSSVLRQQSSIPMPPVPEPAAKKRRWVADQPTDESSLPAEKRRRLDVRNSQSMSSSSVKSSPRLNNTGSTRERIGVSSPSRLTVSVLNESNTVKTTTNSSDSLLVPSVQGDSTPRPKRHTRYSTGVSQTTPDRGISEQEPKSLPKGDQTNHKDANAGAALEDRAQRVRSLRADNGERSSSSAARRPSKERDSNQVFPKGKDSSVEEYAGKPPCLKTQAGRSAMERNMEGRVSTSPSAQSPKVSQETTGLKTATELDARDRAPLDLQKKTKSKTAMQSKAENSAAAMSPEKSRRDKQSPALAYQARKTISASPNGDATLQANLERNLGEAPQQSKPEELKKKLQVEMFQKTASMGPPPLNTPQNAQKLRGLNDVVPSREVESRMRGESTSEGVDSENRQQFSSVSEEASAQLQSEMEVRHSRTADPSATPHIVTTATPTPNPTPFIGGNVVASDIFTVPQSDTMDEKFPRLSTMITLSQQIEHVVGKVHAEMREDTEYYTKQMLKRARMSAPKRSTYQASNSRRTIASSTTSTEQQPSKAWSVFANLPTMAKVPTTTGSKTPLDMVKLNIETWSGNTKRPAQACFIKPTICDAMAAKDVPSFAHYVSLKGNLLAPNILTMNVWPYFGDNYVKPDTFDQQYYLDTNDRERKLRRLLQSQRAEVYAVSALEELGISWNDVLHFLLNGDDSNRDTVDDGVRKAIDNRNAFCKEDFPSSSEKWMFVRRAMQGSAISDNIPKAALLCDIFQRMFKFPLWHIARRSSIVTEVLKRQEPGPAPIIDRTCRICLRFNCHHHGEYQEVEDGGSDIAHESDEAVATDLVSVQLLLGASV